MKLYWYCGMNADTGGFFTEPTECSAEGEIELDPFEQEEFEETGSVPAVECDSCGAYLSDPSHFTSDTPRPMAQLDLEEDVAEMSNMTAEDWEPPNPGIDYDVGDHVLHEGGVWKVVKVDYDHERIFQDGDQVLDIKWVAGPRMGRMVYATGIRSSDLRELTAMEVVAFSSQDHPDND